MLSGNGRHRRPRQAPALLVAAGVTGSAIAIPLLGAGAASAADGLNWDRVAECESGGSWSQNSGNGYYGGLQLTQEDWEKYGGLDYATSADQASRGQQIAVAEKILDDQGVGAWRTCGLLAGLDQDAPPAGVDTGVVDDSTSGTSDSSDSSDSGDSPASSPSSSPSAGANGEKGSDASVDESANSGTPADSGADSDTGADGETGTDSSTSPSVSASPESDEPDKSEQVGEPSADSGAESTGRHRGASAEEGKGESSTSDSSGRHASRGLNAWGGTTNDSSTASSGDSLPSHADSLAVGGGWGALYGMNEQLIGGAPASVLPGR